MFVMGGGLFRMTGGSITGGTADNYGGNVGVGSGTFIMEGGEITGGTAAAGAADVYVYYNEGTFQIKGGKVDSITYKDAASFTLSGNPVIGNLTVATGKVITLGDLTEGASITVDAEGAFTTANTNAAEYLAAGYIQGAEGKEITENGGILSMATTTLRGFLRAIFGM